MGSNPIGSTNQPSDANHGDETVDTTHLRFLTLSLALAILGPPATGFDYPLSTEAIRQAYFLGKENPDRRAKFLADYVHHLPMPAKGPNIGSIEVETPFACIVDTVAHAPMDYHAPDAEHDFAGKPACFRVRVEIYFTPSYPGDAHAAAALGDFWNDFKVHLKQDTEIASNGVHGQPIHSDQTISGYMGAEILVDYDVKKIDRTAPVRIAVIAPGGQEVKTTFDLGALR
ncbi:MAG: hypothetical protein ACRD4C_07050 [Candidatus Acidiferrales bacterium]